MKSHALNAAAKLKFLLNLLKEKKFIVKTAMPLLKKPNSKINNYKFIFIKKDVFITSFFNYILVF